MCVYVCVYVCAYVFLYACACMLLCMYILLYTYTQNRCKQFAQEHLKKDREKLAQLEAGFVAVRCSVLSVLQRVAACCNVLQRVAACCSVVQCGAEGVSAVRSRVVAV